ncbi:hypothetical protein V2A85_22425, partial [Yersinia sp. 1252 StPb PI]|uniref:hypothetical protein n=1 Tax=Yersinia sp. 1252 StPb PI TaxID=3117404 RepID=UPI003B27F303
SYLLSIPSNDIFSWNIMSMTKETLKNHFNNNRFFFVGWFILTYGIILLISILASSLLNALNIKVWKTIIIAISISMAYIGMEVVSPIYIGNDNAYMANVLSQILVGLSFFMLGNVTGCKIWGYMNLNIFVVIFVISFILTTSGLLEPMNMSGSYYSGFFIVTMFGAVSGIYSVFFISSILSSQEYSFFSEIGESSKYIMSYHILIFLLIDIIYYFLGKNDMTSISGDGYRMYINIYSWAVYVPAGVIAPLFIKRAMDKLAKR